MLTPSSKNHVSGVEELRPYNSCVQLLAREKYTWGSPEHNHLLAAAGLTACIPARFHEVELPHVRLH